MSRTSWITTSVLVFLFVGVAFRMITSGPTSVSPSPTAVIGSPAPVAEDAGPPVTKAEAEAFGKELERAFNAGDLAGLSGQIRLEEITTRSGSDLGLPADFYRGMTAGMRKGDKSPTLPPGYMQGVLPNGGRVLRVRQNDGRWEVLVRLLGEDEWVNYLNFKLHRHPSGGVAVEDVFNARTGEWLTADLRGLMITSFQKGQAAVADFARLKRFHAGLGSGNAEAAYSEYRALPDDWKQLRPVRAGGLWALLGLPKKRVDLAAELKAYRETVPDKEDTVSALVALQFHHSKADEPIIRKAIHFLEEWTGGDPYLWVVEARYLVGLGDAVESTRLLEKATAADPNIEYAHIRLISIAAAIEDHKLTLRRFQGLIEHCYPDEGFEDLTVLKHCDQFVRSPEYKQYLAWLAKKRGK